MKGRERNIRCFAFWRMTKRYVLNKYVITGVVFAVMLTFCGENSVVQRRQRNKQIRAMESELQNSHRAAEQRKQDLQSISSDREALERFARETYYMHADNEQVFIINEE